MTPRLLLLACVVLLAELPAALGQGTGVRPRPEMDSCEGAAGPRPVNGVASPGTTREMTVDNVNDGFCGVEINTPGIWWVIQGTGGRIRASTCDARTTIRAKLSVFTGTCDNLFCVGGGATPDFECEFQNRGPANLWETIATSIDFDTKNNQQYYILAQQPDLATAGDFWLSFTEPIYPRNNDCVDAFGPIPRDQTRIDATNDKAAISDIQAGYCGTSTFYPGVWFQLMGTGDTVTIEACSEFNLDGFFMNVYNGATCDDLDCVQGVYTANVRDEARCAFGPAPLIRPMTQYAFNTNDGDRYYIYIHWARTIADQVTGDFRFWVNDGEKGLGGSMGASAIQFAPKGSFIGIPEDLLVTDDSDGNSDSDKSIAVGCTDCPRAMATFMALLSFFL